MNTAHCGFISFLMKREKTERTLKVSPPPQSAAAEYTTA
jgi:hypothetical protein